MSQENWLEGTSQSKAKLRINSEEGQQVSYGLNKLEFIGLYFGCVAEQGFYSLTAGLVGYQRCLKLPQIKVL